MTATATLTVTINGQRAQLPQAHTPHGALSIPPPPPLQAGGGVIRVRRAHVCLGLSSTKLRLCIAHSPKIPELGRPVADPGRHYSSSFTQRPWQQTQQKSLHRAAGRQTGKTSQGRSLLAATRRRAIGSTPPCSLADEALHGLKPRALSCSIRAVHTHPCNSVAAGLGTHPLRNATSAPSCRIPPPPSPWSYVISGMLLHIGCPPRYSVRQPGPL